MNSNSPQTMGALLSTDEVADHLEGIPECSGVYMIFGDAAELLAGTGYEAMESRDPFHVGGAELLYIGSSSNLRDRISCHLKDDSRVSTFRMSAGCLLLEKLDLSIHTHLTKTYFHFGQGEPRLTRWLRQNTAIAMWPCSEALDLEKALIRNLPCPMNISDRRNHPYSRYLMSLRRRGNGRADRRRRGAMASPHDYGSSASGG